MGLDVGCSACFQRPDVGFIGGFVQFFGLFVGFQFLAVLTVLQLLGRTFGQAFPLMGSLHAGVFILILFVHLAVCFAAQQRLYTRLAALGLGDLFPKLRLAETELC